MIRCRRARTWIDSGSIDDLSSDQVFALDQHVASCATCRERLEASRELDDLLESLPVAPVERLNIERSLAAIHDGIAGSGDGAGSGDRISIPGPSIPGPSIPGTRRRLAPLAAAAVVVLAGGAWLAREWNRGVELDPDLARLDSIADSGETSGVTSGAAPGEAEDAGAPTHAPEPVGGDGEESVATGVEVSPLIQRTPFPGWEASEVDPSRYTAAIDRVRDALFDSSQEFEAATEDDVPVSEFLGRVDAATSSLAREGWSVISLVADLAVESEPVAPAALRYLGRTGGRLQVSSMDAALEAPSLAPAAVQALADYGIARQERGELDGRAMRSLARAFWNPEVSSVVVSRVAPLATSHADGLVEWVDLTLELAPHARGRVVAPGVEALSGRLPELLVPCGESGARALLTLAEHELVRADLCLGAFARTSAANDVLAAVLGERSGPETRTLLGAFELILPADDTCWQWLVREAWSGQDRGLAASVMAAYPGTVAVEELLRLAVSRRVPEADLLGAFRRAIEVEAGRMTELATLVGGYDDPRLSRVYLDWLALAHRAPAVPALLVLAASDDLAERECELAVLAVGEVGDADQVPLLLAFLDNLRATEVGLAARTVVALHSLGGVEALARILEGASQAEADRVLEALRLLDSSPSSAAAAIRLERALDSLLRRRLTAVRQG